MMCQECGHRLEVVKTLVLETTTQRLRACQCGSRFLTTETVTRKLPALPATAGQPPGNNSPQSSSLVSDSSPGSKPDQTRARVEPVIRTFLVAGKDSPPWELRESFYKKLTTAYPGVNAEAEFAKVDVWSEANPAKRKTPRGMKAFLTRWFDTAQNNATRTAPRQTASDPRCAFHRAPGTNNKRPRFGLVAGCPECKHVQAMNGSRQSEPTPWQGKPATAEEIARSKAVGNG